MTEEPIDLDYRRNLSPFTADEEGRRRASEAGKKGALVRKEKALARKVEQQQLAASLVELRDTFNRQDLGPTAAALAQELMRRTVTGEIQVRNGDELSKLLSTLTEIARLEAGEATSHTAHLAMSTQDALEKIRNAQKLGD